MIKIILVILIIIVFVGKTKKNKDKDNIYTESQSNIPIVYNPEDDKHDIECMYPNEQLTNFNLTMLKHTNRIERENTTTTTTKETIYFK